MKKLIALLCILIAYQFSFGQDPGDLDITYGVDGIGTIALAGKTTSPYDIGLQSNDRVIVGGFVETIGTAEQNVFVSRLDETGTLDNFGNNINYYMSHYDDSESVVATYVLPDDEIIIAGYYGDDYPFVSRLHADGTIDPFFAGSGSYINETISFVPRCIDVYTTTEGYNIVMSGHSSDYHPMILMLDQYGDAVTTFGTDGLYEFTGSIGIMKKLVVDSEEGCIYTCGSNILGVNAFVSKHNLDNGSLITSFNSTGYMLIEPIGSALQFLAYGLTQNSANDKLVVFGFYYHNDDDIDIYAIRLNSNDGSFDNSFGLNGLSTLRAPGSNEILFGALQQADDKYYFCGTTDINGTDDFMIGRINYNGTMDYSFGEYGFAITDMGESEIAVDIALSDNQSRIYAGGEIGLASHHEIRVACYHTGFAVGIASHEVNQQEISIYPNPASSFISLETEINNHYLIEIFSLDGKLILQEKQVGNSFRFNIEDLEIGMYFLKVSSDNYYQSSKIIKQ